MGGWVWGIKGIACRENGREDYNIRSKRKKRGASMRVVSERGKANCPVLKLSLGSAGG